MTKRENGIELKRRSVCDGILCISLVIMASLASVVFAPTISKSVGDGLSLCSEAIIGAVFPFMIISDAVAHFARPEGLNFIATLFEKLFKINRSATGVFFIGLIGGFPNGARASMRLYESGNLTKEECERLICITSNASPSFIISGIGYLMYGSIYYGVVLYLSAILSSSLVGMLLGRKKVPSKSLIKNARQTYSLSESIKNASLGTLSICGFITFFSVILGLIDVFIKSETARIGCSLLLEISTAASLLASSKLPVYTALVLTSFTISLSGISVYMQVRAFTLDSGISLLTYLKGKLVCAVLSSAITAAILLI